jgi:hypothetical protein
MVKSIKNIKNLPEWFSLDKYEGLNTLDALGWYEQLITRHTLWYWMSKYIDEEGENKDSIYRLMEFIQSNPIVDIKKEDVEANVMLASGHLGSFKDKHGSYRHALGVKLMTFRDLHHLEKSINKDKIDYAREFFKQFDNEFNDVDWLSRAPKYMYKHQDWIDEYVDFYRDEDEGDDLNVKVDMRLPDSILIEQFEAILKIRKNALAEASISLDEKRGDDFKKWIGFGVIPYFDLLTWSFLENVKIPNRVMADAIFPVGEGGEEVVRKTTKPLMNKIFNKVFIDRIASIVAFEKTEGY